MPPLKLVDKVKQKLESLSFDDEDTQYILGLVKGVVSDWEVGALPSGLKEELAELLWPFVEAKDEGEINNVAESLISNTSEEAQISRNRNDDAGTTERELVKSEGIILAYAGRVLLRRTCLFLAERHAYAVVGQNGCGKTTLMKRVAAKDIRNFPKELKVVYVEDPSGLVGRKETAVEYAAGGAEASGEAARGELERMKMPKEMQRMELGELSGGWRMKVAIVRAMMQTPELLCLDEPTNHLDADSISWLKAYLNGLKCTLMIVSHDYDFLHATATDVLHFEDKALHTYSCGFSSFMSARPDITLPFMTAGGAANGKESNGHLSEMATGSTSGGPSPSSTPPPTAPQKAASETSLSSMGSLSNLSQFESEASASSKVKITFPEPGMLEGVKSRKKPVITLSNVKFSYASAERAIFDEVSLKVTPSSRVAITGKNGSGKSTLLKLIIGELELGEGDMGEVSKHMNLRLAYVAQHSMHHLEESMEKSPLAYIQSRFYLGRDKEVAKLGSVKLTEEEEEARKVRGSVTEVVGRQVKGSKLFYEVKKAGRKENDTVWEPLEFLQASPSYVMKLVKHYDEKMKAMASGLDVRPLTSEEVLKHLSSFDIDHSLAREKIRRLSGGQKSRLVLAAAFWTKPHIVAMDEPTNYLDNDTMLALTDALLRFKGGFLTVTHNSSFTDAVCKEKWNVEDAKVTVQQERK